MTGLFNAEDLTVAGSTLLLVLLIVILHHETLNRLYCRVLPALGVHSRRRMLVLVLSILALHTIEIWLFAGSYWLLLTRFELGQLTTQTPPDLFDLLYFSASTYTTVGYGDVVVRGAVRILAGTEALLGLVLITWSASFTFSEIQRTWGR